MNKNLLLIVALVLGTQLQAQYSWIRKADFGGDARVSAVGFSIGNKGYLGTGLNTQVVAKEDFWEYDPATGAWSQLANFQGGPRSSAVGFGMGNKGYIGTGYGNGAYHDDFWEYAPDSNKWTQRANFKGGYRSSAVGFSIGNKGYVGTGAYFESQRDFWEYAPDSNTWVRIADLPGLSRYDAVGFSIGNKGYIGTGMNDQNINLKDFWEYDPAGNVWVRRADVGDNPRNAAVGFSMNGKGYVGTGFGSTTASMSLQSFLEYDTTTMQWTFLPNFPSGRAHGVGMSIGNAAYFGTGLGEGYYTDGRNDFWEFGPCDPPGDPSVSGDNSWNVYVWNEGDGTLTTSAWQNNYMGYYTDSSLSFDTRNKWPNTLSPSYANTFLGCYAGADNHSWSARRQGFPCGHYRISIPGHDNAVQLFIDGIKVMEHDGCCDPHNNVWEGYLNPGSKIEFRGTEGLGVSYGALNISQIKPIITINGSNIVCPGFPVILTANPGADYLWSTGENTQSISVSQAGNYTVKQMDNCGNLIASDPATISELAAPGTDPSGVLNLGIGSGLTIIKATGYAANNGYSFAWYKTGDTTPVSNKSIDTVTQEGDYYVIVSNSNCTSPPSNIVHVADPAPFGDNTWYVHYFPDHYGDASGPDYNYHGYYTEPSLSFDTRSRWDADGIPAFASGYQGYDFWDMDNFKFLAKRKGFPCGHYKINIPGHDDWAELWVNGVKVFYHQGCCDSHPDVWEGDLGPNSTVEFKVTEVYDIAYGIIDFELLNADIVAKPTITPPGPVNICSADNVTLTSGAATGNTWSTGETTQSITVNTAGSYYVTVTNSEGCTAQSDAVSVTVSSASTWYRDADGDGFGNPAISIQSCTQPGGYITNNTDCNDSKATIYPKTWYRDADGDGYGAVSDSVVACTKPAGYVANKTDCNDNNAAIRPGASEVCDGIDNDCDGVIDEGFTKTVYYRDADGDGYGNAAIPVKSCSPLQGYVTNKKDCDDGNAAIRPGATDICDGIDNDCDGVTDEDCRTISIADLSVTEGNTGQKTMSFAVTLNKVNNQQSVSVNYTTQDVTASAGGDYLAQSGTVSFLPGVKKATIQIAVKGDRTIEPNETFKVVLSNPVNATIAKGTCTGTILNDDGSAIAASSSTALQENQRTVFLTPNPASSMVKIDIKGYDGNVTILLTNSTGKLLRQQKSVILPGKFSRQQLDVSAFVNGIYFLSVVDEEGNRQTEKLVVAH